MRHRASRPLIDPWRRLPRATARSIGVAARTSPTRASLAVLLTLGTGTGAFTAVSATVDGSTDRRTESSAVAPRPAPSGPEAPTSAGVEAPAVPFDAEAPAPITLTALPDDSRAGH